MAKGDKQQHDREAYKADYFKSQHVSVSSRARGQFGIEKGKSIPWYIGRGTRWRATEKKALWQLWLEEAQEEAKEGARSSRVKVLNRAWDMERAVVEHICDIVEDEIVKTKKKSRNMSLNKMEFVLKTLRTVQGKANEYLWDEIEEESPLKRRMAELWFLPIDKPE